MAIQKSQAVVLRRQDLRETSIIVTFYTRDFGKIRGILRGVRGARSQQPGAAFEIFALDDIVFYDRKRTEIFTVSHCDLVEFFPLIRESLDKLAHAAYMIELLDSMTVLSDKDTGTFDLIVGCLKLLEKESSARRIARVFEIKFMHASGILPFFDKCVRCSKPVNDSPGFSFSDAGPVCKDCRSSDKLVVPVLPGTVKFIQHVIKEPFEKIGRVKVAQEVGKELERILRKALDVHLGRRLKTIQFIKEIE